MCVACKILEVKVQKVTLLLEEKVLFKLLQWAGLGALSQSDSKREMEGEIAKMLSVR